MKETTIFDWMIRQLTGTVGEDEARSIARIVLREELRLHHASAFDQLNADQKNRLDEIIGRLKELEPLAYILGVIYFYNLELKIDSRALIPRPETEELVDWIVQDHKRTEKRKCLLDIGTGSGCIPLAMKKRFPEWTIFGMDVDPDTLQLAMDNGEQNQLPVNWLLMDVLDEQNWTQLPVFDIIVSNPPYISEDEAELMPDSVKLFEPRGALFVKNGGPMLFYQKTAKLAVDHLHKGGCLYMEINEFRPEEVKEVFLDAGFSNITIQKDLQGKDRMIRVEKD